MLSVLFDRNFFIGIFAAVIVVVLIILFAKYKSFRTACCILLLIVYAGVTAYCIVNLNIYYNASGGIFGTVTGIFKPTVSIEETSFTFENVELVQYLDTDTYSCKILVNNKVEVDDDKNYMVYVNERPCSNVSVNSEMLTADYRYQFFDESNKLLCDDTLLIRFAFSQNESAIYLATYNGTKSVNYWNYYFNKNGFVVTFRECQYESNSEINFGEGEVPNIYKVEYQFTDDYTLTKYYEENAILEIPVNLVGVENWTINGETLTDNYKVTSDVVLTANFYDINEIGGVDGISTSSVQSGKLFYSSSTYDGLVYYDNTTQGYAVVKLTGYGWEVSDVYSSNCFYATTTFPETDAYLFDATEMKIYSVNENIDRYYYYKDGNYVRKMLYSIDGEEGLFVKDLLQNIDNQVLDAGDWTSYSTSSSSKLLLRCKFGSFNTQVSFDFITNEVNLNPVYDATYGIYKTESVFKIAYIEDGTGHLYCYDVLADKTTAINTSAVWESKYSYDGENTIIFARGYSASVAYELTYNFETGKSTIESYENPSIGIG